MCLWSRVSLHGAGSGAAAYLHPHLSEMHRISGGSLADCNPAAGSTAPSMVYKHASSPLALLGHQLQQALIGMDQPLKGIRCSWHLHPAAWVSANLPVRSLYPIDHSACLCPESSADPIQSEAPAVCNTVHVAGESCRYCGTALATEMPYCDDGVSHPSHQP